MLLWRERIGGVSAQVETADVTHMNGFGVVTFHSVSHEVFRKQLLDPAVEPYHVVVARMLPAAAALADGVAVIRTNVVGGEIDAGA